MDDRREELVYRKINQLTALLIAGGAILLLLVGIVAILLHGQVQHTDQTVSDLQLKVAEFQRLRQQPGSRPPASGSTATAPTETRAAPATPKPDREVPGASRSPALADRLAALAPDDPEGARLLAELETLVAQGQPIDAADFAAAAKFEMARGNAESALTWAERALAAGTHDRSVLLAAADAAYRLGKLTEARGYADRALTLPGPDAPAQLLLGKIVLAAGGVDEAAAALQAAKRDPAVAAEAALILARIAFQ
ncbi:MAG: CDC27 family protein, partial [Planctomycetota bacterium]